MNAFFNSLSSEPNWAQIRPLLDDAMHTLDEPDREAVLLRHFEHRSFAEIGEQLGVAENTARMRVTRALEKLEEILRKRGVTSTALALAGILTANGVGAAPAHLAGQIARTALTGATAGGASALAHFFSGAKGKMAAAVLSGAVVFVVYLAANSHREEKMSVLNQKKIVSTNATISGIAASGSTPESTNSATEKVTVRAPKANERVLHLEIVAADSGLPIPHVPVECWGWVGNRYHERSLVSTRQGGLDVIYPANTTELKLTTREDDFAGTRLLWHPPNGDVIPTNYVLKLDRPVAIGGLVIDAEGNPAPGARVYCYLAEQAPGERTLPQSHEFGGIETTTDNHGRWRINRIAADVFQRLSGTATKSNYVDAIGFSVYRNKTVEEQLRSESLILQLGAGFTNTVHGVVVDGSGMGVRNAKILVGGINNGTTEHSESQADGNFMVTDCPPGMTWVTATAQGYAATTVDATPGTNSEAIRIVLRPGKVLRLRVVNQAGEAVRGAEVNYDPFIQSFDPANPPPQVTYNSKADQDGRTVWTNVPDAKLSFTILAKGYQRGELFNVRPDDEEHVIKMIKLLTVHGAVTDESTGQPIPHFRMGIGSPQMDHIKGGLVPFWTSIDRFWIDFAGGFYRKTLDESPLSGQESDGYFLKFTADGYSPVVSRLIKSDEGDVKMDIALKPAVELAVLVYAPDGQPAINAEVGLVLRTSHLKLNKDRFSEQGYDAGDSLRHTGPDGSFKLPIDPDIVRVIAVNADGYGEASPERLATNPIIQMQPWARLEVTCLNGGKPEAGRKYVVELGTRSFQENLILDLGNAEEVSEASGRFSISFLPPGEERLTRMHSNLDGTSEWGSPGGLTFKVRPGETTTLTLDENDQVVENK